MNINRHQYFMNDYKVPLTSCVHLWDVPQHVTAGPGWCMTTLDSDPWPGHTQPRVAAGQPRVDTCHSRVSGSCMVLVSVRPVSLLSVVSHCWMVSCTVDMIWCDGDTCHMSGDHCHTARYVEVDTSDSILDTPVFSWRTLATAMPGWIVDLYGFL